MRSRMNTTFLRKFFIVFVCVITFFMTSQANAQVDKVEKTNAPVRFSQAGLERDPEDYFDFGIDDSGELLYGEELTVTMLNRASIYAACVLIDGVRVNNTYFTDQFRVQWDCTEVDGAFAEQAKIKWTGANTVGGHTLVGMVQYEEGGEWYRTEAKTVSVTSIGCLTFDLSGLPKYLVEGEDAQLFITLPSNATSMSVIVDSELAYYDTLSSGASWQSLYNQSYTTDATVDIDGSDLINQNEDRIHSIYVRLSAEAIGYLSAKETIIIPIVSNPRQVSLSLGGEADQVLVNENASFILTLSNDKTVSEVRIKIGNAYDYSRGIVCTSFTENDSSIEVPCKISDEYLGEQSVYAVVRYDDGTYETTNQIAINVVSLAEPEQFDFVNTTPIEAVKGKFVTFSFTEVEHYSKYGVIICDAYGNQLYKLEDCTSDNSVLIIPTAVYFSPGVYYVRGYTEGTEGYAGGQSASMVKLTIKNEGIIVDSYYDEVGINQKCPISISAPGAIRIGLSIDGQRVDSHEDESIWNKWNSSLYADYSYEWQEITDAGTHTLIAYAQYEENGEWIASESKTILVTVKGKLDIDVSNVPSVLVAGEDASFSVSLLGGEGKMSVSLWGFKDGSGISFVCETGTQEIVLEGKDLKPGKLELYCSAHVAGYEYVHKEIDITVIPAGESVVVLSAKNDNYDVLINSYAYLYVHSNEGKISDIQCFDGSFIEARKIGNDYEVSLYFSEYEEGTNYVFMEVQLEGSDEWICSNAVELHVNSLGRIGAFQFEGSGSITVPQGRMASFAVTESENASPTSYWFGITDANGNPVDNFQNATIGRRYSFSTAGMTPGEYFISCSASGNTGYRRGSADNTARLLIADPVTESVCLETDTDSLMLGEGLAICISAPGADYIGLSIDGKRMDVGWSGNYYWQEDRRFFSWNDFSVGSHTLIAYAKYQGEDWVESAPKTITVICLGEIVFDLSNIPFVISNNSDVSFTIRLPENAEYMNIVVNEYPAGISSTNTKYSGLVYDDVTVSIPKDEITPGHFYSVWCKTDRIGYIGHEVYVYMYVLGAGSSDVQLSVADEGYGEGKVLINHRPIFELRVSDSISINKIRLYIDAECVDQYESLEAFSSAYRSFAKTGKHMIWVRVLPVGEETWIDSNFLPIEVIDQTILPEGIEIQSQPQDASVEIGKAATFAVEATGEELSYLWEYKRLSDTTWKSWKSKMTATISVPYDASRDGMQLRCKITDGYGNVVRTDEVMLSYFEPVNLEITSQPQSVTVETGKAATFSVEATGEGLSYLWEYKRLTDTAWKSWKSMTTATIKVTYQENRDGMLLRCKITDAYGNVIRTDEATLTYRTPVALVITSQPQSVTVGTGKTATFAVEATGDSISYLWEYKRVTDTTWKSWKSMTEATINVAYQANRDGMLLRCKVTDGYGNVIRTDEATLTYRTPVALVITSQPQSTTVETGKAATFAVEASGEELSYLWEYKRASDTTWKSWKSKTNPTLTVPYDASRDGMQLRCKITDGQGNVIRTEEVTLSYQ